LPRHVPLLGPATAWDGYFRLGIEQPSGRKLLAGASLVLAIGASVLLVLFLEWRDPFVRSLRDVNDIAGHEIGIEIGDEPEHRQHLIDSSNPIGRLSNQYRRLCNDMDALAVCPMQSLGIISVGASEGRSTVASNLALARLMKGQDVLLVDADLRPGSGSRPAALLDLPATGRGLYESLVDRAELQYYQHDDTGLCMLAAAEGMVPDMKGLLSLGANDFSKLIAPLAKQRHCLVDLPPVDGLEVTLELASQLDSVLLVTRSGHTHRKALKATMAQLEKRGIACSATVLLNVPKERMTTASLLEWPFFSAFVNKLRSKEVKNA